MHHIGPIEAIDAIDAEDAVLSREGLKILIENIDIICSLDHTLQIMCICSI